MPLWSDTDGGSAERFPGESGPPSKDNPEGGVKGLVTIVLGVWLMAPEEKEEGSELERESSPCGESVEFDEGQRDLQWRNKDCLEGAVCCAVWATGTLDTLLLLCKGSPSPS